MRKPKNNRLVSLVKESGYQGLDTLEPPPGGWSQGMELRLKEVPFGVKLFQLSLRGAAQQPGHGRGHHRCQPRRRHGRGDGPHRLGGGDGRDKYERKLCRTTERRAQLTDRATDFDGVALTENEFDRRCRARRNDDVSGRTRRPQGRSAQLTSSSPRSVSPAGASRAGRGPAAPLWS